ncbi:MAG TPA: hypothetical protein VGW38_09830, partial [Chloroflexota bacterium]|nr:hypothetical protein [Chloroflexota bacterium]
MGTATATPVPFAGTPWAWGANGYGQLGDGTTTNRFTPVQTLDLTDILAVSGGDYHSLALKTDGTVWAWGASDSGQLGNGTMSTANGTTMPSSAVPVQAAIHNAVAIAAGSGHNLALRSDGTVWAWGANHSGQVGDGTTVNRSYPVQVSGLSNVTAIAAGQAHSLAVQADGTLWTWGANAYGQLGDGTTTDRIAPTQIAIPVRVTAVAAGRSHSLALGTDGTVWRWGNAYGVNFGPTPGLVSSLDSITAIATGEHHSLALKRDGTVWAWGNDSYGQLGDGANDDPSCGPERCRVTPIQVSGLAGIVTIASGGNHNFVRGSDGTVWAWGDNWYGQLGDGSRTTYHSPVVVQGLADVPTFSLGRFHTLAVRTSTAPLPSTATPTATITPLPTQTPLPTPANPLS